MANRKIILGELDLDTGKMVRKAADLNKEIAVLTKQLREARKAGEQGTVSYEESAAKLQGLKSEYKGITGTLKAYNKDVLRNANIIEKTDGSIDQLNVALKTNRTAYRGLSKEQRENQAVGGKLKTLIENQDKEYKDLSRSIGQNQVDVGNYGKALEGTLGNVRIFGVNIGQTIAGLKTKRGELVQLAAANRAAASSTNSGTVALKGFKIALVATGIGAILVALGSFVAFLTKSQRGLDKVNVALKAVGAVMDVVVDRAVAVGEKLFKAFENPQQAVKDLWKAIQENVVNRFQGLVLLANATGRSLQAAFRLDFSELKTSAIEAAKALGQVSTGLSPEQQERIAKSIKGVGDEMKEEAKAAADLEKASQKLRDTEIGFITAKANLTREIEKRRLAVKDENLSNAERLKSLNEAVALEDALLKEEKSIATERARISQAEIDLGESTADQLRENQELQAKVIELETQTLKRQRTIASERLSIVRKLSRENSQAAQKRIDELIKSQKLELQLFELQNQSQLDGSKKLTSELLQEEENRLSKLFDKRVAILQQQLNAEKISVQQFNIEVLKLEQSVNQERVANMGRLAEQQIATLRTELELFRETNKSKLGEQNTFSQASIEEETKRLSTIKDKELEILNQQLEAKKITQEQFDLEKIKSENVLQETIAANQLAFKQEQDALKLEQQTLDFENELLTLETEGASRLAIRLDLLLP